LGRHVGRRELHGIRFVSESHSVYKNGKSDKIKKLRRGKKRPCFELKKRKREENSGQQKLVSAAGEKGDDTRGRQIHGGEGLI